MIGQTLLPKMAERSRYFYADVQLSDEMNAHFTPARGGMVRDRLSNLSDWNKEMIHAVLAESAETLGLKL